MIIIFILFFSKNIVVDQYSVIINVLFNNITVLFYKNMEDNQFESSLNICIYGPKMIFELTENSKSYQVPMIIFNKNGQLTTINIKMYYLFVVITD